MKKRYGQYTKVLASEFERDPGELVPEMFKFLFQLLINAITANGGIPDLETIEIIYKKDLFPEMPTFGIKMMADFEDEEHDRH